MSEKNRLLGGLSSGCWLGLVLVFLFLVPSRLAGQVGGAGITGAVTDPTGAAVDSPKVTVRNEATNIEWNAKAGAGIYEVRNLPPGLYTVSVESPGFQKAITEHVQLEVDKVSVVDVKLPIGEVTQSVNVTAIPDLLNGTSGTVGSLVTQKEIETIPLNGRSWINLNYLTPGAAPGRAFSTNYIGIMAPVAPVGFTVNGLRAGNNLYFIDGVNMQDVETNLVSIYPPLDALQEFRTETGNSGSEYVGGAGAVVSAVTKSGTNKFHGSAWEYLRNDVLDARNYFATSVPPLKRNQFGATFGGPIRKDKTFFFASYEGFRQVQGLTFVGDYPTQAMRNGDLSGLSSTPIIDPLTGVAYPGNVVTGINPLSTKWLNDIIPLPNTNVPVGQGNYRAVRSEPIDYDSYVGRVDHRFNDKASLLLRYMQTDQSSIVPEIVPTMVRDLSQTGRNAAAEFSYSFSPTVLAEAHFGYHAIDINLPTATTNNINILDELGVNGKPGFTTDPDSELGPNSISVSGFAQFENSATGRPLQIYNYTYYYDGLVYVTRGKHSMKMGGGVSRITDIFPEIIAGTGNWNYDGTFSGSAFADFLLGYPRNLSTDPQIFNPNALRWTGGLWFQDDWKATSRLTLNLGLRWDVDGRYVSQTNTVANYDLSHTPTAINITGNNRPPGWGPALFDPQGKLWSPRVGFAYRATANTVVRGGYGIYWQPMTADPIVNFSINAPFVETLSNTYDVTNLPTFDRSNPLANSTATAFGITAIQKDFTDANIQQWNLTVERTVGKNLFLSAAYVGNKGTHLVQYPVDVNLAPPGPGPLEPRRPFTQFEILPNAGGVTPAGLYPAGGSSQTVSNRDSHYNALQLQARRRLTQGMSFIASYAYGKSLDDGSGSYTEGRLSNFQQPAGTAVNKGLSEFDVRHTLTLSYIYELPFGRGRHFGTDVQGIGDKLISGWQVEGLTRFLTGSPVLTPVNGYDNLNNGGSGYPDQICSGNFGRGRSSAQKVQEFFNTACFVPAGGGTLGVPNYTFGDAGRNNVSGPGTQLWDIALQKNTGITERVQAQFRAEFFNAFNHANFDFPNNTFGTPQFGTITATSADNREIQFGLKIVF
jgi:hypothetical protein